MNLFTSQQRLLDELNRLRRLHSLSTSPGFILLYDASKDKTGALKAMDSLDIDGLNYWIREQRRQNLEFMTSDMLRQECRLYAIQNYHLMTRDEMIARIELARKEERGTTG